MMQRGENIQFIGEICIKDRDISNLNFTILFFMKA